MGPIAHVRVGTSVRTPIHSAEKHLEEGVCTNVSAPKSPPLSGVPPHIRLKEGHVCILNPLWLSTHTFLFKVMVLGMTCEHNA